MHLPMGNIDTSVAGVEKCSAVDEALSLFYLYIQDTYSSKEVELVSSLTRFIPEQIYDLGNEPIDMDSLLGRECYGGLDLSNQANPADSN